MKHLQPSIPAAPFVLTTSCAGHAHVFALDIVLRRDIVQRGNERVAMAERVLVASEADGHNLAAVLAEQAEELGILGIGLMEAPQVCLN